jgi:hypothetical protein
MKIENLKYYFADLQAKFIWHFLPNLLEECKCGKPAQWAYMPADNADGNYCDDCVPRGCNCNNIEFDDKSENAEQHKDEKSRLLPCCEYWYDEYGWNKL